MELLNNKIGKVDDHKGWYDIEDILNGNIVYNAKLKNIICRLSALLDESYSSNETKICNKLFGLPIDIEHIQSYHDSNGDKQEDILREWKEDINSIGNLMVLEENINRSISNGVYEVKLQRYPSSSFSIVNKQVSNYPAWDLGMCQKRKQEEVKKLLKYLFGE